MIYVYRSYVFFRKNERVLRVEIFQQISLLGYEIIYQMMRFYILKLHSTPTI